MFAINPFAELSASIPPAVMQTYAVVMILLVVGGTLYDIIHKKSAKYFFNNWEKAKDKGTRQVSGGEMVSLAVQTALVEGLTSGEFCNPQRRISHLLTIHREVQCLQAKRNLMSFPSPFPRARNGILNARHFRDVPLAASTNSCNSSHAVNCSSRSYLSPN